MCCDSFVLFIWTRVGRTTCNALSSSSSSEISLDPEKMHIPIWTLSMASSMQAALHMVPNYAKNLEIFQISEFENIESLCQRLQEIQKSKIYSLKIPRTHRGRGNEERRCRSEELLQVAADERLLPVSDNLTTLMFIVASNLSEAQRERLTSSLFSMELMLLRTRMKQ